VVQERREDVTAETAAVRDTVDEILATVPVVDQLAGFEPNAEMTEAAFAAAHESQVRFVSPTLGSVLPEDSYETSVAELAKQVATVAAHGDRLVLVRRYSDVEEAIERRKVGILANFQNSTAIGTDLANLDLFFSLGVRQIQLTFNWRNWVGDGCTERTDCGLTYFGVDFVKRMNELGVIVDVSHSGPQTTYDAIEVSEKPILFSHTNCKAICDHPRNKTDDQIKALAAKGGVMGVSSFNWFVSDNPVSTLADLLDHYDHVLELVGPDHVGIGSDFELPGWEATGPDENWEAHKGIYGSREWEQLRGRFPPYIPDVNDARRYATIAGGLIKRGHSAETVGKVLGLNMLRVYREVLPH
jgi:membrane dipeptidase